EKRAMSTPASASGLASATSSERPSTETTVPADRPEARSRSSRSGNSRSTRTEIIVLPTRPVAPTTATVRGSGFTVDTTPTTGCDGRAPLASIPAASPRTPGADAERTGRADRPARRVRCGSARRAGEVPLHGGLPGEVDPALAVDLGDGDHDLVAD